jgi:hypothetical protein
MPTSENGEKHEALSRDRDLVKCPTCDGTGEPLVGDDGVIFSCACGKCHNCGGTGTVDKNEEIVRINEMFAYIEELSKSVPPTEVV